jgi:dTMP kinase
MSNSLFITLEGGEGAGKSTQIKKLAASLRTAGHDCVETREPGGTPEAEALREIFITHKGNNWPPAAQVLLMNAARSLHTENMIKPALASGKIVLCDRYSDSTRVYQGVAVGYDVAKIDAISIASIGDFAPDLTFIFDVDPACRPVAYQGTWRQGRYVRGEGHRFSRQTPQWISGNSQRQSRPLCYY